MLDRRAVLTGVGATMLGYRARAAQPLPPTPHEILGPFYPLRKPDDQDADLTRLTGRSGRAAGEVIEILGQVAWRNGSPATNTEIEIWQANAAGRYAHPHDGNEAPLDPNFQGYARIRSRADGSFRLLTVRPGPYRTPDGRWRTRHIHFDFTAADYRLVTQMYFEGEPMNDTDGLLTRMAARGLNPRLLIAGALPSRDAAAPRYHWNVVLR